MPVERRTREEEKARTRARLIAAARTVFARRGFHRALLSEIADEAGHTTGAIYSNFAGKEELFLAVLDEHIAARLHAVERAVGGAATPAEGARAAGDDWMRFLREDPDWYPLFVEFWGYAVRDAELRGRVAALFAAFPEANARLIAAGARNAGIELSDDDALAAGRLVTALSDGLALIKVMDPRAVPDELLGDGLAALLSPPAERNVREGRRARPAL